MRAIEAQTFSGYGGLRQVELPKPQPAKGRVLVRVAAAGVTPLDHTILSGGHPRAKAPLVLGNEGAGVIEDAGDSGLVVGSRVMFTGPYGVREDGAWQEWLLVRTEDVALVPDSIDDVVAARRMTKRLGLEVGQQRIAQLAVLFDYAPPRSQADAQLGDLGLGGEWAERPIHAYGIKPWNGFEEFVRQRVLSKEGKRGEWREDIVGRVAARTRRALPFA